MIESNSSPEWNETEPLQEIRFITGSKYEGMYNAIDKKGIGRYTTPQGVVLDGEFRNNMLHGHGSMHWPCGQIIDGVWNQGKLEQRRYTFTDGLTYQEKEWNYCVYPDRRFYNCIINGLRPAGKVLKTNEEHAKLIPSFCYNVIFGIFDPREYCTMSFDDSRKILSIPTMAEIIWIKRNCRKGWLQPTAHQPWIYEYWDTGMADFAMYEDETEIWWQRLRTFARFSFVRPQVQSN